MELLSFAALVCVSGDLLREVRFVTLFQPSVEFSHVLVLSITETVLLRLI